MFYYNGAKRYDGIYPLDGSNLKRFDIKECLLATVFWGKFSFVWLVQERKYVKILWQLYKDRGKNPIILITEAKPLEIIGNRGLTEKMCPCPDCFRCCCQYIPGLDPETCANNKEKCLCSREER